MRVLLLVDIQNDFLPGGALPVPRGDEVVSIANTMIGCLDRVVATQDWHPRGHQSFASSHRGRRVGDVIDLHGLQQVLWPDHCIQETHGADFAPGLRRKDLHAIVHKGMDPEIDSYSGFADNGRRRLTGLADLLRSWDTEDLFIMGLATDYCVRATALDARAEGFRTHLITDGIRGVDLKPGDCHRAREEMRRAGVREVESADLIPPLDEWGQYARKFRSDSGR